MALAEYFLSWTARTRLVICQSCICGKMVKRWTTGSNSSMYEYDEGIS